MLGVLEGEIEQLKERINQDAKRIFPGELGELKKRLEHMKGYKYGENLSVNQIQTVYTNHLEKEIIYLNENQCTSSVVLLSEEESNRFEYSDSKPRDLEHSTVPKEAETILN